MGLGVACSFLYLGPSLEDPCSESPSPIPLPRLAYYRREL